RPPRPIQAQGAVDAVYALVVPGIAQVVEPVEELPKSPAPVRLHLGDEGVDHRAVPLQAIGRRPVPSRPRQSHHPAGPHHRQLVRAHHLGDRLPLRGRRHDFRLSTSLIAAFSSASSAYIRFSLAFSSSSSRSRRSSWTVAPPYRAFQLK